MAAHSLRRTFRGALASGSPQGASSMAPGPPSPGVRRPEPRRTVVLALTGAVSFDRAMLPSGNAAVARSRPGGAQAQEAGHQRRELSFTK